MRNVLVVAGVLSVLVWVGYGEGIFHDDEDSPPSMSEVESYDRFHKLPAEQRDEQKIAAGAKCLAVSAVPGLIGVIQGASSDRKRRGVAE